jgi:hypothetical protein
MRAGAALALSLTGCAIPVVPSPSGGTIYQATTDVVQYRSPLPRDVSRGAGPRREAYGTSCRTTVTFPISPPTPFYFSNVALQVVPLRQPLAILAGDAGFASAMARARQSVQDAPIYDVRVDLHTISVLGLVRRDCLEIHAAAAEDLRRSP